jgi:predicted nucleic acid-binding protein
MILVDSDVLIAHLRGVEAARAWLTRARRAHGQLAVSVVTIVEVGGGARSNERKPVQRLLSSMRAIPITEPIAWRAGELMLHFRPSHRAIGLGDYLIAASAELEGLELATLNVKHFPGFSGLTAPFTV